jgi:hypothetical protein
MKTETLRRDAEASAPATPWWRVGMVWLVLGGPAVVVVASLITVAIAVDGAEEVLTRPPTASQLSGTDAAQLPAMQGRNHAATPRN